MKSLIYFLFVIVLLNTGLPLNAQDLKVRAGIGYGTYLMEDMRDIQCKMKNNYLHSGFSKVKNLSEFPGYLNYHFDILAAISPAFRLGFFYSHYSTGGRLGYEDYSGSTYFDQLVKNNCLGGLAELRISQRNYMSGFIGIRISTINSQLKIESSAELYDQQQKEIIKFESGSIGIEPYLAFEFPLYLDFSAIVNLGFAIDTGGELKLDSNSGMFLLTSSGNQAVTDWSGGRISIALSYGLKY